MTVIKLPHRGRGRRNPSAEARYQEELEAFCSAILQIRSTLDFNISARGWCYILEEHGLGKGDFNKTQNLIVKCRKQGLLPLNVVAEDTARKFNGLQALNAEDPEEEAKAIIGYVRAAHKHYLPFSFWKGQGIYLQAFVEKIDLKNLFAPVFEEFHIPFANTRGWSDLNSRAELMGRFRDMDAQGKRCVLLYCGDHDPGGLAISNFLRSNMAELSCAVGWSPNHLEIDRFGLNYDFIKEQRLTWIDNLETSSGGNLDNPKHPNHNKPYVQDYLSRFGARKCEANALVIRPEAGRKLCRKAVLKYLDEDAPAEYFESLAPFRHEMKEAIVRLIGEARS